MSPNATIHVNIQSKKLVARDVLLQFPNHSLPFELFAVVNNFQIGVTTTQERNLLIAYLSKKLIPTQHQHITIEREM